MRRSARLTALAAFGGIVLFTAFAHPALATGAAITLSPKVGPPTTKVTVSGSGFGATETVLVQFDSSQVATTTTTSSGTFRTSFTVPKAALPGSHAVVATGQTSGVSATKRFLVRTDWPQFHFGPANTGYNTYENVIGPGNVSTLITAWTGATGAAVSSSPAVAKGVVYAGSGDGKLYAFSAGGTTGCSGTPKTCNPLWTGATGNSISAAPAVANGVVYVGSEDSKLYAFSAAATTGCSGTPKTCKPLWTGTAGSLIATSPTVANGFVYVYSDDGKLYAFTAGTAPTGCSGTPMTCNPLWTASTGEAGGASTASPAVANGVVYIGSNLYDELFAFSANGTTGCTGIPKTCSPLWTGTTTGNDAPDSPPAVANGVVYIGSLTNLYAFNAGSSPAGCSGTPKTCSPLWTAPSGEVVGSPAVANGMVYVGSEDWKLHAFAAGAAPAGCSGTPKVCSPLWTGATGGSIVSSPAVANGVVYLGSDDDKLYAFGAAGTTGCSGTPSTCSPLWTGATGSFIHSSPAVANGVVYVGSDDDKLYAFGP